MLTQINTRLDLAATDYLNSKCFAQQTCKVGGLCNNSTNTRWFVQCNSLRIDLYAHEACACEPGRKAVFLLAGARNGELCDEDGELCVDPGSEMRHWSTQVNGVSLHVAKQDPATGPVALPLPRL